MIWAWAVHVTGSDYGLPYGRFSFYDFFSGFGANFGELAIIGGLATIARRHNCHVHGCWRVGRHPVDGTSYVVCRQHHPDGPVTAEQVTEAA